MMIRDSDLLFWATLYVQRMKHEHECWSRHWKTGSENRGIL